MVDHLRLGLVFSPSMPPESIRSAAASADAAGLDDFWLSEDCFKESAVASAVAAFATGPDARARVDAELGSYGMPGGPEVGAVGDARAIADRMLDLATAGVTGISVQPCADEPDVGALAHFLGEEVRPLLQR